MIKIVHMIEKKGSEILDFALFVYNRTPRMLFGEFLLF